MDESKALGPVNVTYRRRGYGESLAKQIPDQIRS